MNQKFENKFIRIEKVAILIEFWIVYLTTCGLYILWNVRKLSPYNYMDPLKADQSFNIRIILILPTSLNHQMTLLSNSTFIIGQTVFPFYKIRVFWFEENMIKYCLFPIHLYVNSDKISNYSESWGIQLGVYFMPNNLLV